MRLLAFGEVLYDVFGERKTIGGAPLNVSYHFHKCGGDADIISAVGDDDPGRDALSFMKGTGIGTEYVTLSNYPTGRADVSASGSEADYVFNAPCAWDDIRLPHSLTESVDVFYWGTLALRSEKSRETFHSISSSIKADIRYFDVNIRKMFYSEDIIIEGLESCNILKVNENELPLILSLSGKKDIPSLKERYSIDIVILTEGEKGSTVYDESAVHIPAVKTEVVDTVGAGDSYSACFLHNYIESGDAENAARKASLLSSFVCSKRGGMPDYDIAEVLKQQISLSRTR